MSSLEVSTVALSTFLEKKQQQGQRQALIITGPRLIIVVFAAFFFSFGWIGRTSYIRFTIGCHIMNNYRLSRICWRSTQYTCLLTLNQPRSGKSVNYRGPFSFDLAFTRVKVTSPGMWQMCNRALRFREFGQNGAAILLNLDRGRPDWKPASPPTLYAARDEKLTGMLPGAALHCRPEPGGTSPALGWSVKTVKPVRSREVGMVAPRQNF